MTLYRFIDPSIIQNNLMNNQELIVQFLTLYEEQIPVDLEALKDAVEAAAHLEIGNKAHHIKPTMEYIGAHTLREKLQQLEHAGKNGVEIDVIQTLFSEIQDEITALLQEISDYRRNLNLS